MSNQEMQFADPDWEPTQSRQKPAGTQQSPAYTPQPINDDRSERFQQPAVETPPAQEVYAGYSGYARAVSEQPRQAPYQYQRMPPPRRRRRRAWLWIIIAILFFSLMSGGASTLGNIGQHSITQSFPISSTLAAGTPTIIINDPNGNIQVHRGGSLNIQEVKNSSFFDDPNNINVKVDQSGSTITMSVDTGTSLFSSRSVDFNITVPQDANLQLTTTSGDISVNGTNGAMTLSTVSGNISTSNDTFAPNAILSATSGDISMEQDTLHGPAKVNTASGNIDFNGTFGTSTASPATYQFNTDSGDVRIGFSANANVNVQAGTTSGSINAGGFSTINVLDNNQGPGSHASGAVGTPPYAQLNIDTTSGDITFQ